MVEVFWRPRARGVDTRALVQILRENGVMMGAIGTEPPGALFERLKKSPRYEDVSYVDLVSVKSPVELGEGRVCIGVVDCGVKKSIIKEFVKRG